MAQTVYILIYIRVFFNIDILAGHISLRLVVVIVRHKVFNGIVWKKLLELRAQLCGKYFVVGKNKGGAVDTLDNICHGEGLSRACYSHKCLFLHSAFKTFYQCVHSLGLIPGKLIIADKFKVIHNNSFCA